jgi:uncharacterized protein YkwD
VPAKPTTREVLEMPKTARPSVRRRALAAVVVVATLALGISSAPLAAAQTAQTESRARLLHLINTTRERHGLPALRLSAPLSRDAMRHTHKMIRQNRVFDPPNLEEILNRYPYDLGAATVGCADTLQELHRALMHSEIHRSILLNPGLRRVGIGLLTAAGTNRCGQGSIWATEIFYG